MYVAMNSWALQVEISGVDSDESERHYFVTVHALLDVDVDIILHMGR